MALHILIVGLYELWKSGRYMSYPPNILIDLVAKILALVPPWTRVYRVQRCAKLDITKYTILSYNVFILLLFFRI